MSVKITGVEHGSLAEKHGIEPGSTLVSINGHGISDVLDYRYFETEQVVRLELDTADGAREVKIKKGEYDSLGLEFETYLMDKQRSCRNKCIFCFIDQLPGGLRESLYFKDDDERLSFLFGNYITLTNLSEHDVDRIIKMHISPVNISVHTTNPELRVKMMNNRFAGESLAYLRKLAQAGVAINCQLVLCPGINDGDELRWTLTDLLELSVQSIAIVPVGLTCHRDGLYPLRKFTAEEAGAVIDIAESFGETALSDRGSRTIWAADELYLAAGRPLPDESFYEDFAQLENGVGISTLLREEFKWAVDQRRGDDTVRKVTLATGVSAAQILSPMLDAAVKKWHNSTWNVLAITNNFFGKDITVAGLVTGRDLIDQLRGKDLGDRLLIPAVMLRREGDLFLDSLSVDDVSRELGVTVVPVPNDGEKLLSALLGEC